MKLYDGGVIIFLIVGIMSTVIGGHVWEERKFSQEYKFYSTCLDNALTQEEKELCTKLFTD